ncbi:hypothetical protein JXB02_05590 [Candidatus Woesearchaeota archaeon]|nr:hypothetical protein [Candidatus Woesearchaeota archaeon]
MIVLKLIPEKLQKSAYQLWLTIRPTEWFGSIGAGQYVTDEMACRPRRVVELVVEPKEDIMTEIERAQKRRFSLPDFYLEMMRIDRSFRKALEDAPPSLIERMPLYASRHRSMAIDTLETVVPTYNSLDRKLN